MKRSITNSNADAVEAYGLEVNLLSPENLSAYQIIMSKPNAGIVPMSIREDAEVIL